MVAVLLFQQSSVSLDKFLVNGLHVEISLDMLIDTSPGDQVDLVV